MVIRRFDDPRKPSLARSADRLLRDQFGYTPDRMAEAWNRIPAPRQLPDPLANARGRTMTGEGMMLDRDHGQFMDTIPFTQRNDISTGARRMAFNPSVEGALREASRRTGVPLSTLRAFVTVESGGNPATVTGSYQGLFQLSREEFNRHGGSGSILDPDANAMAGARKIASEIGQFNKQYGRNPSDAEIYMIHQQGWGGFQAHMKDPSAPAWRNMASTGEGRQKGSRWAQQAIWGNLPASAREQFGSVDNVTSADFMRWWGGRIQRAGGSIDPLSSAPQTAQAPAGRARGPAAVPGMVDPSNQDPLQRAPDQGVVDPMNPEIAPQRDIQAQMVPISPVGPAPPEAPTRAGPPGPRGSGGSSLPGWAVEAFQRADNQPVSPVQSTATIGDIFQMPAPPPSTDRWMEGKMPGVVNQPQPTNRMFPKLGPLMFGGGIGSFFSGIFSGQ